MADRGADGDGVAGGGGGRRTGARVGVLFTVAASLVVLVAVGAGWWAADRTAQVARDEARSDALAVARRTAAVINAAVERSVTLFAGVARLPGLDTAAGPGAEQRCAELLNPLSIQGFSFEVLGEGLEPVCVVQTDVDGGSEFAAGTDVVQWVRAGQGWDRLGPLYEPTVRGRMTMAPAGHLGTLAVAVPTPSGRVAVGWIESWRLLAGPMGVALSSPGVATAVVVDDVGRIVVPAPRLRDGQPSDSQARPASGGLPVADPIGRNATHARISELAPGVDSGVRPSTAVRGGSADGEGVASWVTAPIPRMDSHVAVAYEAGSAVAVQDAARRNALWVAAAVAVAALVTLGALWYLISRPLVRLAGAVRSARGGGALRAPTGGPSEVRALSAAFHEYAETRQQFGEVAAAARERERERVVAVLNEQVAQSVAAASLLVRSDPEAAAEHLRVAATLLGRVTSDLAPPPLPAGGVGPALVGSAAGRARVEDRSEGRRLDPVVERLLHRTALEVIEGVEPPSTPVRVVVERAGTGLQVELVVTGGGPSPVLDDPDYLARHEFVAYGGIVERGGGGRGRRRLVLVAP